jgi:hypothetical protein
MIADWKREIGKWNTEYRMRNTEYGTAHLRILSIFRPPPNRKPHLAEMVVA